MTYTKIIEKLDNYGMDTVEVKAMMAAFQEADDYESIEFYQNQLYGFLCGLAALHWITPDEVNGIMNELEAGNV
ncbi:MAG: hypothetical protein LIO54_08365 [Oscillospiraceae bacterium]|nr:hypothetical protein [Oscillospiraceae bacterium]